MSGKRKGGTPPKQDWWDGQSSKEQKKLHKEALEDYLKEEGLEAAECEFSVQFVKDVIDDAGYKDQKWRRFPKVTLHYKRVASK